MLVLTRLRGQSIFIGNDVEVSVEEIRGDRVRLGITAPGSVRVLRDDAKDRAPKPPTYHYQATIPLPDGQPWNLAVFDCEYEHYGDSIALVDALCTCVDDHKPDKAEREQLEEWAWNAWQTRIAFSRRLEAEILKHHQETCK